MVEEGQGRGWGVELTKQIPVEKVLQAEETAKEPDARNTRRP